uniref:Alternative protein KCNH1 n=1 Tax=Homo sapiens TaxID=9606 RepID=L8EAS2_HUMAN|nr:alternative protein KCNH1 [Homo sapiens]
MMSSTLLRTWMRLVPLWVIQGRLVLLIRFHHHWRGERVRASAACSAL